MRFRFSAQPHSDHPDCSGDDACEMHPNAMPRDYPDRDLPRRDPADAPHPLAPVAECDSEHLWAVHEWDSLKWVREPGSSYLFATYAERLEGSR